MERVLQSQLETPRSQLNSANLLDDCQVPAPSDPKWLYLERSIVIKDGSMLCKLLWICEILRMPFFPSYLPTPTLPPTPRHTPCKGNLFQVSPFWNHSVTAKNIVEMNNSQWLQSLIKHTYNTQCFHIGNLNAKKKKNPEREDKIQWRQTLLRVSYLQTNNSWVISNTLQ